MADEILNKSSENIQDKLQMKFKINLQKAYLGPTFEQEASAIKKHFKL